MHASLRDLDMAGRQNLTILIADDHRTARATVRSILEENGFRVIGEASDGDEAVRLCRDLKPDTAVLDLIMPRLTGVDAARQIKIDQPNTKIIVLSMHPEPQYILESLRAGASGYLSKGKAAANLPEAIEAVCRGETYVRAAQLPT